MPVLQHFQKVQEAMAMIKTRPMCVFAAIFIFLVNPPVSARTPTMCNLEVSVREFAWNASQEKVGTSIGEIYRSRDKDDPYFLFARQVEGDLLGAARANICSDTSSDAPLYVDITFLKLWMFVQNPNHAQISERLAMTNGAYADVEVDKQHRKIKATIIWNPRRMLRDQLILEGYDFDDTGPLPPFLSSEVGGFVDEFDEKVLGAPSREVADAREAELKGTMPDDLYGLLVHSGRTTRMSFGHVVSRGMRRLLAASHTGHAAIVQVVIDGAFEEGASPKVNSIRDINRSDIEELYLSTKWSLKWSKR